MATYYNKYKTATITDRGKIAAIERLLEACEAAGVEIVDDPSPNQVGGIFFEDVYGIEESDSNYCGFWEIKKRYTCCDLIVVDGWAYEFPAGGECWNPIFDPCDIEKNASGVYVVTELGTGGRRDLWEVHIHTEYDVISTGVFTENSYASTIWNDSKEDE